MAAAWRLGPEGGLRPATYATIFGLIAATGLRRSEALHLRCSGVDLDGAFLTIRTPSSASRGNVPIHATVVAELRRYLAVRARHSLTEDSPLFLSPAGGFIAKRRINKVFQKLRSRYR
ncbi:Uncharacterized protein MLTONO_5323 [Mesorhizobium loti]|nr:Uncharacterized protein MLTONO_5323 [Mesorhizobium loti]